MSGSNVGVVITCYELGRTLPEAVESVWAQTEPAREIIVVDDGSEDVLTRQVLVWLEEDSRPVRVIRSEHRGAAYARNLGLAETTAPLAVLLDGDDAFEPRYLELAADVLRDREDLSFVCCALQAFGRASYRWKPPPYTVAEALGRGACGHISTVFRREVWERNGGFDESLPAYEDVDFWLRALQQGYRGVILDEALVRYRVRKASRYHSAIVRGEYLRAKQLLVDRHLAGARGEDVLATLLDFQRELVGHARSLEDERVALEDSLAGVEAEVSVAREQLLARGVAPFEWGRFERGLGETPRDGVAEVEAHFIQKALREAHVDRNSDRSASRTLIVEPGDAWPARNRPVYDLVVVAGALETAARPGAALARCHGALRAGGKLIVVAAAQAIRRDRNFGFTEASLRALLCELFPLSGVKVKSYGNLLTCLGTVAGTQVEAFTPAELTEVDPDYPTVVLATAELPPARKRLRREASRRTPPPPPGRSRRRPRRGVILAYHRIAELQPDTHQLCTPPELFALQMELVAERYLPLALQELADRATAGELEPGTVAVSFDDGYLDNLEMASPVLRELSVPGTFFVDGSLSDEPQEAWWDTAERVLLGGEPVPERLLLEVDDFTLDLPSSGLNERRTALLAIHGRLLHAEPARVGAVIGALADWSGLELPVRDSHRLMTASEVAELAERSGHEIGAHGLGHRLLPAQRVEAQAQQLRGSKAALERLLDRPVEVIAYPYGACDLATADLAEEAGFAVGCTVEGDPVTCDSDPLRLPRLEIADVDIESFGLRLEAAMSAAL